MPFVKRLERRVVRTLTQHRPTWPRDKRPLETIDTLTRANRAERNRGTERRLVELRFDAFRRLESPHKPPVWPRAVPDVFVGESIPEVSRPELSVERLHSAIRNHGSLLVRGLVDRDGVERLVADIDTALDAFDARAKGDRRAELDGWYEPFEHRLITSDVRARRRSGGNILAVESPPTMFDLIEIFNASGVGELVHDYFAERPAILARKVTLRRMPRTASGVWHQDGAFMGAGIRSLNIWLALTPCGVDAPSLDVVARRFDHLLATKGTSQSYGVNPDAALAAANGAVVRPVFEPGDALLFDHMCLHRTGGDSSMRHGRYAIETWFFAPSTYGAMTRGGDGEHNFQDQLPLVF